MRLWSEAFREGQEIPVRYTKDGHNVSPPLRWAGVPAETRELALLFEGITPIARAPWVHWLLYRIPADARGLPEGFEAEATTSFGQGRNASGGIGYDGPLGTVGRTFHYRITLAALDAPLDLDPGLDKEAFERSIDGHILGRAELHTHYKRQR